MDRLAFSAIFEFTPEGKALTSKTWFGRTVIRSCGKLAYGQAQAVIENPEMDWSTPGGDVPQLHCGQTAADVKGDILALHKVAQVLRRQRYSDGALRLNKPKLAFKLDDDMMPVECFPYITREANQLVEEFMLKANMAVAEHIAKAFPSASLLRRHPPPLERKLEGIVKVGGGVGADGGERGGRGEERAMVSELWLTPIFFPLYPDVQ